MASPSQSKGWYYLAANTNAKLMDTYQDSREKEELIQKG